jgi:phenylalanyl-tRNA synthetase beta chain
MKISYNWLQSFFKKKLPVPEKLADLLTRHSFETEVVNKQGADYLLDVDVLPNRAHDCLSYLGLAREIAALLKYSFEPVNYNQKIKVNQKESIENLIQVEVKDKNLCPRYTAGLLNGVKVGPSPQWMQERLKVCGLRPISNIVDIANYVMLETGQPLHAFDTDKLEAKGQIKKIIVRRAAKGEKITTLDSEKYDLDENVLVIADEKNPVCVAGIKGGQGPGINQQTKRIILEAANFSPQIIRQGSRQLKLETDASWRFEHQVDPNLTEEALAMATALIQEIAGGQAVKGTVDFYPNKVKPQKIKLEVKQVAGLLGVDIPTKEIKSVLERLGFGVKAVGRSFQVMVPTRRLDVTMPEDLIEEIGRVYGFEKIPSRLPAATLIPPIRNEDLIYQNKVREILVNLGFSEVYNYSFISEKDIADFKLESRKIIEVANPVSQEQKYLRPELAVNLIKNIRENKKYFEEIRLFEVGGTFWKGTSPKEVNQRKRLAAVISLAGRSGLAQEFYHLKGVIGSILNKLGIGDIWYDDALTEKSAVPAFCRSERRAEVKIGQEIVGWLGEIDHSVLNNLGIKSKVAGFKLDFDKLVELATEERIYLPPSKYPAVVRDIALLVEPGTKVVEVLNLIHTAGGPLIRDIDLFDIYEGEKIPQGKKNLAFHIIYQAEDRTLTEKEINQLQEKIIKALEEEGGWQIRK